MLTVVQPVTCKLISAVVYALQPRCIFPDWSIDLHAGVDNAAVFLMLAAQMTATAVPLFHLLFVCDAISKEAERPLAVSDRAAYSVRFEGSGLNIAICGMLGVVPVRGTSAPGNDSFCSSLASADGSAGCSALS